MNGPRLLSRAHALALAGLILLPACAPRKAIPSDPPEVRTEADVRGERKGPPPPRGERAPDTRPVTHDTSDVVIAEVTDPKPSNPPAPSKPEPAPQASKAAEPKAEPAPEAKAEAPKAEEPKQQTLAPKPEPSPEAKADAAEQAAKADPAAAPRTPVVQIASFTTEKNAEAARAWLTEKGYADARVARVEQGQTVFHRVQAGPFQDLAAARKALEELKADWPQAFIPAD